MKSILLMISPIMAQDGTTDLVVKDKMIRECGMFKYHSKKYLTNVKNFVGLYTIETVQRCMQLCCEYEKFNCQSFSYSERLGVCNLIPDDITEQKSSKDLQDSTIYNFYLRIPFSYNSDYNLNYNDGKCYQRRLLSYRWRWENPRKAIEKGPYIPHCDKASGIFFKKQCDAGHATDTIHISKGFAKVKNEQEDQIETTCFCIDDDGNPLEETRSQPEESTRLICSDAEWFVTYMKWRKRHFHDWFPIFDAYLDSVKAESNIEQRGCPTSVGISLCHDSERQCYVDHFGCRYCHCVIEYSAIIDGTCVVSSPVQVPCIANGQKIRSVSKCASQECCFEEDPITNQINCFKRRDMISDTTLVVNWDADRKYVHYLYNLWKDAIATYKKGTTPPPQFPGTTASERDI